MKEFREHHPVEEWHWSQYPNEHVRTLLDVMHVIDEFKGLGSDPKFNGQFNGVTDPETGENLWVGFLGLRLRIPDDFQWTDRFTQWVIKVSKAAPGISSVSLFQIARYYQLSFDLNLETAGLDAVLSIRAWESRWSLWGYLRRLKFHPRHKISVPGGHLGVLFSLQADVRGPDDWDDDFQVTDETLKDIEEWIWETLK